MKGYYEAVGDKRNSHIMNGLITAHGFSEAEKFCLKSFADVKNYLIDKVKRFCEAGFVDSITEYNEPSTSKILYEAGNLYMTLNFLFRTAGNKLS